jgi:hypothetical protein
MNGEVSKAQKWAQNMCRLDRARRREKDEGRGEDVETDTSYCVYIDTRKTKT